MTLLSKVVTRETYAHQFECGKHRAIIVALEPPGILAFRLKGTQRVYRLPVSTCFMLAVKASGDQP